jgi:hypothetical protein
MRLLAAAALAALCSTPSLAGDLVVTKSVHSDAVKMMGHEEPAKDTTEVTWIGTDRIRIEEGDSVTIVRADLKKLFMLDTKAKTVTTIDLPFDIKKYVPAEYAGMMEQMMSQTKVTVTPTEETKKIKDWNATKHVMTTSMPMGGSVKQDVWLTKEVQVDAAAFAEMYSATMSLGMGGTAIASEYKKLDGFAVLTETTTSMMGQTSKSREEVTSVETKDAPEGHYDVPKDFTEKAFDPMAGHGMGGR